MGFKISKEFPSRFLKGHELDGKEVPVVIREVKKEKAFNPKSRKEEVILVAYFQDKERGVVLKKTRSNDLVKITGSDDTDAWIGQKVTLYTEKKKADGEMHDVFRFKA